MSPGSSRVWLFGTIPSFGAVAKLRRRASHFLRVLNTLSACCLPLALGLRTVYGFLLTNGNSVQLLVNAAQPRNPGQSADECDSGHKFGFLEGRETTGVQILCGTAKVHQPFPIGDGGQVANRLTVMLAEYRQPLFQNLQALD